MVRVRVVRVVREVRVRVVRVRPGSEVEEELDAVRAWVLGLGLGVRG